MSAHGSSHGLNTENVTHLQCVQLALVAFCANLTRVNSALRCCSLNELYGFNSETKFLRMISLPFYNNISRVKSSEDRVHGRVCGASLVSFPLAWPTFSYTCLPAPSSLLPSPAVPSERKKRQWALSLPHLPQPQQDAPGGQEQE